VAASLLNVGRQVGGSIGLAVLGTVAWTVVAGRARGQASTAAYRHALAAGFDRAFLVAAAIAVLTLVVAITTIRLRRADLAGD
jgi:electron transfer flavoprotein alpha/beta subunit